jgi:organic hydroperoxide reductase OsmC/OhrA
LGQRLSSYLEADGAAAELVRAHSYHPASVDLVWQAIALHTSAQIAERRSREIALPRAGIAMDFGARADLVPDELGTQIHQRYPRLAVARRLADEITRRASGRPAKTPWSSLPGCMQRERRTGLTEIEREARPADGVNDATRRRQDAPALIWRERLMQAVHRYKLRVLWTGNTGTGTSEFREFERSHEIDADGKPTIFASAAPGRSFRGEASRWNPEELLVASLSQCHMLWYLFLCSREGVVVTEYVDRPHGTMVQRADGGGRFEEVVLEPMVTIASTAYADRAAALHDQAHEMCFIANSVNFPVRTVPTISANP